MPRSGVRTAPGPSARRQARVRPLRQRGVGAQPDRREGGGREVVPGRGADRPAAIAEPTGGSVVAAASTASANGGGNRPTMVGGPRT